jgi:hypothetical protein
MGNRDIDVPRSLQAGEQELFGMQDSATEQPSFDPFYRSVVLYFESRGD